MKKIVIVSVPFLLGLTFVACQKGGQDASALKTLKDSLSYSIGISIGKNMQQDSIDVDPEIIAHGIRDALDKKPALNDSAARETITRYSNQRMAATGEKNKKTGEAFLEANKKKTGVISLPSGLQYRVITEGTGRKPKPGQTVVVNYRGMTVDGKEFDSSYRNGQPVAFQVDRVIKGWTEALERMPVGSKWEVFVPPDLAYGEHGVGQIIGPNSTLIFELELLAIK